MMHFAIHFASASYVLNFVVRMISAPFHVRLHISFIIATTDDYFTEISFGLSELMGKNTC